MRSNVWQYLILATLAHILFSIGVHLGYHQGFRRGQEEAVLLAEKNRLKKQTLGKPKQGYISANVTKKPPSLPMENLTGVEVVAEAGATLKVFRAKDWTNLTTKDYMIVVSHYKEDPTWLQKLVPYPHVVYSHNKDPDIPKFMNNLRDVVKVPNMGREASSYLKYILDHYEELPPVVAFIHAHRSSWHQIDMTETLRFLDQAPKWGYMSLNDATKGGGGFKKGWKSGNITRQTQKLACYTEEAKGPNKVHRKNTYDDIRKAWPRIFAKHLGNIPERIYNDCCAQFAVTREHITMLPKKFYQTCYDWLDTVAIPSERSGRVFEQMWRYIFVEPGYAINEANALQC
eukprot:CAMPEP_0114233206 /NCGR_PEP_ID=MMETSP0058-20121206/5032_1 /TAXON_ID=36894 /ORGANISM="Pyramimonas parkeae, CCMP726" /LENGTH=343 /DNA_ID=CAMNT_0001344763 /DNA_START=127 /DNA_END=1158 /DNA_ORIENTATION=+